MRVDKRAAVIACNRRQRFERAPDIIHRGRERAKLVMKVILGRISGAVCTLFAGGRKLVSQIHVVNGKRTGPILTLYNITSFIYSPQSNSCIEVDQRLAELHHALLRLAHSVDYFARVPAIRLLIVRRAPVSVESALDKQGVGCPNCQFHRGWRV